MKKVALVTGAGRGIGLGIAKCLASEGCDIVVGDIHEETGNTEEAIAEEGIHPAGGAGTGSHRRLPEAMVCLPAWPHR